MSKIVSRILLEPFHIMIISQLLLVMRGRGEKEGDEEGEEGGEGGREERNEREP